MDRTSNTDIYKTTIAAEEEAAMVIVAPQEEVMNNQGRFSRRRLVLNLNRHYGS